MPSLRNSDKSLFSHLIKTRLVVIVTNFSPQLYGAEFECVLSLARSVSSKTAVLLYYTLLRVPARFTEEENTPSKEFILTFGNLSKHFAQ